MNEQLFSNGSAGLTLSAALTSGATTAALATGGGAKLPALANGDYIVATLSQATSETSFEIVRVTAISGDSVTIARGQEGSTAAAWAAGDKFEVRPTAGWAGRIKPLWRYSAVLANATPVVVALAGTGSSSVYRASVLPSAGDSVLVESGTSAAGPWTSWANGTSAGPAANTSYPNAAAPVTHLRVTRVAGSSALSRFYIDEISN